MPDNFELNEIMEKAREAERISRGNPPLPPGSYGPGQMLPELPYPGLLSRKTHPLLYPLAEIAQIVDQLRPLFVCSHGITRSEQEAPSYPRLIRAALDEVEARIALARKELDRLESQDGS